jgi:polyhydroxyalkanoate synthesis regulator phasin
MFTDTIRKALLAGVGVQEKLREVVDDLVKKGDLSQSQASKVIKEWTETAEKSTSEISKSLNDTLAKALERMNLPTKQDMDKLGRKVQTLSARVKRLEGKTEELEEKAGEEEEEA